MTTEHDPKQKTEPAPKVPSPPPDGLSPAEVQAMIADTLKESLGPAIQAAVAQAVKPKEDELKRADDGRTEAEKKRDKSADEARRLRAERDANAQKLRDIERQGSVAAVLEDTNCLVSDRVRQEFLMPDVRKAVQRDLEAEARKHGGEVTQEALEAAIDEQMADRTKAWLEDESNGALVASADQRRFYTPGGKRMRTVQPEMTAAEKRQQEMIDDPELPMGNRVSTQNYKSWLDQGIQEASQL